MYGTRPTAALMRGSRTVSRHARPRLVVSRAPRRFAIACPPMLAPKPPMRSGSIPGAKPGCASSASTMALRETGRMSSISTNLSKSRKQEHDVVDVLEADAREARVAVEHRPHHEAVGGEVHHGLQEPRADRAAAQAVREDEERQAGRHVADRCGSTQIPKPAAVFGERRSASVARPPPACAERGPRCRAGCSPGPCCSRTWGGRRSPRARRLPPACCG